MQPTLRIERVMKSNSTMFSLFEYNKLVTPLDNFLSIRSLESDQRYDTVLPIPETVETLLSINVSGNIRIMCLERVKLTLQQQQQNSQQELQVVRYENGQRRCIRLQARATRLIANVVVGNYLLYGLESADKDFIQMHLIDCQELKVRASGFLDDRVKEIELINWGQTVGISVLFTNDLKIFQCVEQQPPSFPAFGFVPTRTYHGYEETIRHRYMNNQFMVASLPNSLNVYKDYHLIQRLPLHQTISALETNSFGFFAFTEKNLLYFRQRRELFEKQLHLSISGIDHCYQMEVSPSDNLLVLSAENGSMVSVWINNEENNQTLKNQNLTVRVERTSRKQLVCMAASSATNYLAIIEKVPYCLSIYDLDNSMAISYQLTQTEEDSIVVDCCFHPLIPILAVAYRTVIKFYCMLYSEIKQIRQLAVVRCRKLFYSHCGNFFGCVTGKGKGVKVSLYETRTYSQVETLWIGGEIVEVFWSNYDNIVYVVAEHAFLYWMVDDLFKERKEVTQATVGRRIGGFCDWHNRSAVMILEQGMLRLQPDNTTDKLRSAPHLLQVLPFMNGYLLAGDNGTILSGPTLQIGAVSHVKMNLFRKPIKLYQCKNRVICRSEDDELVILSERDTINHKSIEHDIILADRRVIDDNLTKLKNYERDMKSLQGKFALTMEQLKMQFKKQQTKLELNYRAEIAQAQQKQLNEKEQKHMLEKFINDNSELYAKQQFQAVGELEKLYERKLVLTTNKLLTSEEINIRNQVSAEKNLKELSTVHDTNIRKVRESYFEEIKKIGDGQQKDRDAHQKLHKEYQQKILQIEEEYETMLRDIQLQCDTRIRDEKMLNAVWQNKFTKSQSEKANLQQAMRSLKDENDLLTNQIKKKESANQLMERKVELSRKDGAELERVIKDLEDRLAEYEYKVKDLEKAKEILTFRVLQTRNLLAPKQKQLSDFEMKFEKLEAQFDKTSHEAQQNLQRVERLKRDLEICRKDLTASKTREKSSRSRFDTLVNKLYDIVNHSPAEAWNQCLLKLYDEYCQELQHTDSLKNRSKDTVEQLNRMREHLEDCLSQVITSNEKIHQRKAHQFVKKTQQNAELLTDINDLRRQLKDMRGILEQKNNEIERLKAQRLQSQLADQRRLKTEGHQERRRSKFSEGDGRKTFYRNEQHDSTAGFSSKQFSDVEVMESRHSKRTPSAQKTGIRRGNNFNRSFRVDLELNRHFQQEEELRQARRQLQLQQQLIMELKSRASNR